VKNIYPLFVILLLSGLLCGCQPQTEQITSFQGLTMGTLYSVKIVTHSLNNKHQAVQRKIDKRLDEINFAMSTWLTGSELQHLNRAKTDVWHNVSAELLFILGLSKQIFQQTEGFFDISVAPLVNLWGFGPTGRVIKPPADEAIQQALRHVGLQYLVLDEHKSLVRKSVPLLLDLSAIAKGYAVDEIASLLEKEGIARYLVEIGGEIRAKGQKLDGQYWRVAIEAPLLDSRQAHQAILLKNMAVATSGDYRNYFQYEGQHYAHTIDPRTGMPVLDMLGSVSVFAKSTAKADALATAMFAMGFDRAQKFAEENDITAFFIARQGEEFVSKGSSLFYQEMINR
jgi:FAD:protein FMN transferase